METIRELLISLGLDADQAAFVEAIGLEKLLEKGAELLVEALKEIPKALAEVVKSTTEYGNEIADIAERTGLTTDQVQQLGYVAGVTGESIDAVEVSINHLARAMDAARTGNDEAIRAFGKLGVHVTDAHGKLRPVNDVLTDLAGGFQKLPKGAERSAVALQVLGRSGTKMLNVLGGGPEAVARLKEEFEDLGIGMDEGAIERADELNKTFNKLGMVVSALKREFAGPLIKAIKPLADAMLAWVKANRELIRQKIEAVATAIGKALAFVAENAKFFLVILGALAAALFATSEISVMAALEAAAAWAAAAAPVLLLAAIFAALILILDDVRGYLEGEDSLLGDIGPKWTKFLDDISRPHAGDPWWLAALRKALWFVTNLYDLIPKMLDELEAFVHKVDIGVLGKADRWLHDKIVDAFSGGASGPAAAAAVAGPSRAVSTGDVNAHIEIHPPPGASPDAIAGAAVDQLDEWHGRKLREAQAAVGE